ANPASLNPAGWGVEQTLWIAVASEDIDAYDSTRCPASYTNGVKTNTGRPAILTCRRNNNTGTEDPGAFATISAGRMMSAPIAVRHGVSGSCTSSITLDDVLPD